MDGKLRKENIVSRSKNKLLYETNEENKRFFVEFELRKTLCPNCLVKKTDSYLFEVKIRVEGRSMREREVMFLVDSIRKICLQSLDQNFVYRFSENKDGVDVLVSSKKLAEQIVSHIRQQFYGKLVQSYKLVSETHDRIRVFKTTYSYRIISPSVGSVYRVNNQLYQVESVGVDHVVLSAIKIKHKMALKKHELIAMYTANRVEVITQEGSII